MSPTSPKRRKIDHEAEGKQPRYQKRDDQDDSEHESSNDDDAPTMKTKSRHVQSKGNNGGYGDEGALYAGGLFKSSMFKFQVDYLLEESRPNYEKIFAKANETLGKIKGLIESIKSREPLSVS
jgi:U3 small nucleolar RNA-associated protein 22